MEKSNNLEFQERARILRIILESINESLQASGVAIEFAAEMPNSGLPTGITSQLHKIAGHVMNEVKELSDILDQLLETETE